MSIFQNWRRRCIYIPAHKTPVAKWPPCPLHNILMWSKRILFWHQPPLEPRNLMSQRVVPRHCHQYFPSTWPPETIYQKPSIWDPLTIQRHLGLRLIRHGWKRLPAHLSKQLGPIACLLWWLQRPPINWAYMQRYLSCLFFTV